MDIFHYDTSLDVNICYHNLQILDKTINKNGYNAIFQCNIPFFTEKKHIYYGENVCRLYCAQHLIPQYTLYAH